MFFTWDDEKEKINIKKHGINFSSAAAVFLDEVLDVVGVQEGAAPDRVIVAEDRNAVPHNAAEDFLEGLGHHAEREVFFLEALCLLTIIVGFKERQDFACRF